MRRPPFYRRILPWIFVIVFFAVAPAVVFYTAGYRWSTKKGAIERNGTVILDTTPAKASIQVDGRLISDKTPVTIQNMPPGVHRFTIQRDGYHSWEKSLDVIAEQVTFANDVLLWKNDQPINTLQVSADAISISPDNQRLLMLDSSTPTHATIVTLSSGATSTVQFQLPPSAQYRITWSNNNRYALVEHAGMKTEGPWLIDSYAVTQPMHLPVASYRWSGSLLIGNTGRQYISLDLTSLSLSQTPLLPDVADTSDFASLQFASGTQSLVFVSPSDPKHGLVLPPGNWTFWSAATDHVLLRDGDLWLSLQQNANPPVYHLASGDFLRSVTIKGKPTYLLVNRNEIWTWNPLSDPELILRQSDRIVQAAWHSSGSNFFYATDMQLFAVNLDPRDGRITTPLATFDHISDFTAAGKTLYVTGKKDGKDGVWSITTE